jgi:hypothetical protein
LEVLMNLKNKCLVCSTTEKLNTTMKVKVDEVEHEIAVCDEHAEDMTMKIAKELIKKKIEEYENFKKMASEFGVEIKEQKSGVLVASRPDQPAPTMPADVAVKLPPGSSGPPQPGQRVIKAIPKHNINISGSLPGINPSSMAQTVAETARARGRIKGDVTVPVIEEVELQTVPGRQGLPMTLQKKVTDSSGTTEVRIVETSNEELTKRSKVLENQARQGDPNAHLFIRGYDLKDCNLCRGSGKTTNGQVCPKCKGKGLA